MAEVNLRIATDQFRIKPDSEVRLQNCPTLVEPHYGSKKEYEQLLASQIKKLRKLQYGLYAADTYALLIVFQAMDAAGKDSMIRHVMSGINPQGCQVFSFKHPSATELEHDFLWRTTQCLPERGRIGIFNRSYYEEVLVVRVHPEILAAQRLPDGILEDNDIWKKRYQSINDHERHLHSNGTRIIKFFLHVSRDEQRRRFLARIDEPDKNWKFSSGDVAERKLWDEYMRAYEHALQATSTARAPWYAIPADDKKNARLLVAEVIVDTLESMKCKVPDLSDEEVLELQQARESLLAEGAS